MRTELLTLTPAEFCRVTGACAEGREWAVTQPDMATVWDKYHRPHWLLWILLAIDHNPVRELRLFAVWCARNTPLRDRRVTGDLLTDSRSLAALDVAERYANGLATAEELRSAAAHACASNAAYAAANADFYAAYAAAYAAANADFYAAYAAAYAAANAAFYAAYDAARYAAACDDANAAYAAQADQLRRMIDNPFRTKEAKP